MLQHKRLLELALKGLEAERLHVDEEIAAIQAQLNSNAALERRVWLPQHQTNAP